MSWVSTGSSLIHLDLVVLLLVPHMAAARPRPLQPRAVDLHPGPGPVEALLLPRHGVPLRHADLLQREAGLHRLADRSHAEVLLLGCESEGEERDHAEGTRCGFCSREAVDC